MVKPKLILASVVAAVMAGTVLTGCATETPEVSFCKAVTASGDRYANSMWDAEDESGSDPRIQANELGDVTALWSTLASRAPETIRANAESLRDSWLKREKTGSSAGSFNSGAIEQIHKYVLDTCSVTAQRPEIQSAEEPVLVPERTRYLNPGLGYRPLGEFLYKNNFDSRTQQPGVGSITIFGVYFGEVVVKASTLFPNEEVVTERWTVTGNPGHQYLAGVVETRIASSGLDPEQYVLSVVALDLDSGLPRIKSRIELSRSGCKRAFGQVMGSNSDTFAFSEYRSDASGACNKYQFQVGLDAATGARMWELDVAWDEAVFGTLVGTTFENTTRGGAECYTYTGLDIATGRTMWAFDSAQRVVTNGYCDSVKSSLRGDDVIHMDTGYKKAGYYLDIRTGVDRTIIDSLGLYDPVTKFAVAPLNQREGIKVYDTVSGKTVYELSEQRRSSLGAAAKSLFAGRLFLTTSDQSLEIDVKSGEIVRESESIHPKYVVGDYVYFDDGKLVPIQDVNSYRPSP